MLALSHAGGFFEVADPRGLLALLEAVRNRHSPVGLKAGRPEAVANVDRVERHRRDIIVPLERSIRLLCGAQAPGQGGCEGYEEDLSAVDSHRRLHLPKPVILQLWRP